MLHIGDIRDSRVYKDAVEEGKEQERRYAIVRMAKAKMSAKKIAAILEMDEESVRRVLATSSAG